MLRNLVFAATMALGLGGGLAVTHSAQAAVMQTGPSAAVAGVVDTASPGATPVYYGYGYRRCWVRRVWTYYGWRYRRVCHRYY
jgi:hypothetical protein